MTRPDVTPTTEIAYAAHGPLTENDEATDWTLLRWLDGLMRQLDEMEQLSRDTDTHAGWGQILDINTVPDEGLGWLSQFVGVPPRPSLDPATQRIRILESAGWRRGSLSAIRGAARQALTGNRQVQVFERDDSPYHFRIRTYKGETPDTDALIRAVTALKPAGLIFEHELQLGLMWSEAEGTWAAPNAPWSVLENLWSALPSTWETVVPGYAAITWEEMSSIVPTV